MIFTAKRYFAHLLGLLFHPLLPPIKALSKQTRFVRSTDFPRMAKARRLNGDGLSTWRRRRDLNPRYGYPILLP